MAPLGVPARPPWCLPLLLLDWSCSSALWAEAAVAAEHGQLGAALWAEAAGLWSGLTKNRSWAEAMETSSATNGAQVTMCDLPHSWWCVSRVLRARVHCSHSLRFPSPSPSTLSKLG